MANIMVKSDPGNPIQVQTYLKDVDYPVEKDDLVETARQNGAPDAVMRTLRGLPDREYRQPTDVTRAMGEK